MIEKINSHSNVSELEFGPKLGVVSGEAQTLPDVQGMIEEQNVRDALSMAQGVLVELADTIRQQDLANSPDADRNSGRMSAEIFDLVST